MALSDINKGRLEQAGSTLVHKSELVRQVAARHILKLEQPNDVLLRWRIGIVDNDNPDYWAKTQGSQGDAGIDPSRWPHAVLGVEREKWERLRRMEYLQPAVAYRIGSAITMVGIRELGEPVDFTVPVNTRGEYDDNGPYQGVVMRGGPGFEGSVGTANQAGDYYFPLDTVLLARLGEVPEGLHRV
ncbi:MAG TPA: hypothetical protein VFB59_03865 [Candidatus Saccharimonadales bacterium]|nr:hypothetical protein [Candidatus Saccharimonadales bacterium]